MAVERESSFERIKSQLDADWQRRCEDTERDVYEKQEELLRNLTKSRNEVRYLRKTSSLLVGQEFFSMRSYFRQRCTSQVREKKNPPTVHTGSLLWTSNMTGTAYHPHTDHILYQTRTDHIPTIYCTNHVPTTYVPTTYHPHTNHIHQPHTDNNHPHTDHIPTMYQPHTDQINLFTHICELDIVEA